MGLIRPSNPQVVAGITASTTQTQGQGAQTAAAGQMEVILEVSVCATTNDTITLPATVTGRTVTVINNGAQTLRVFPPTGSNLGAGANTAVTLATTVVGVYVAYNATTYKKVN